MAIRTVYISISLFTALIWVFAGIYVRRHPENISGINTMPREKRNKLDLQRVGRFISNMLFSALPFILIAPFMPSEQLFEVMLIVPAIVLAIIAAIYLNVFENKFKKQ